MAKHFILILIILLNIWVMHSEIKNLAEAELKDHILESFKNKPKKEIFKVYHYLYKKNYDLNTEEGLKRYRNFKNNLSFIEETNSKNLTYKLKIGPFTDMTFEEFKEIYLMKSEDHEIFFNESRYAKEIQLDDNFKQEQISYDWTSTFGSVEYQGMCGSCYAYAALGAIEGNYQKYFGDYIRLSKQQVIDCAGEKWRRGYNYGCNGGNAVGVFDYIIENGFIDQDSYREISPTTGLVGSCQYSKYPINYIFDNYESASYDRKKILYMLSLGPLSAQITMDRLFMSYGSGILDIPSCDFPNHAIIIVGVSYDNLGGYYIGRNSWGVNWGEKGYFRIRFNDSTNTCNMEARVLRPIVKKIIRIPEPIPYTIRLFAECGFQGNVYDINQSSPVLPNFNGLVNSMIFRNDIQGKRLQIFLYSEINCRGYAARATFPIRCFDIPIFNNLKNKVKSILIHDLNELKPRTGCIWVYDGCCFTSEKIEICDSIPNLSTINFSDRISAFKVWGGIKGIEFFTGNDYSLVSTKFDGSRDASCIDPLFENKIKSIKIIK
jgi:KDEL-tailed cysteine endopeptidase